MFTINTYKNFHTKCKRNLILIYILNKKFKQKMRQDIPTAFRDKVVDSLSEPIRSKRVIKTPKITDNLTFYLLLSKFVIEISGRFPSSD